MIAVLLGLVVGTTVFVCVRLALGGGRSWARDRIAPHLAARSAEQAPAVERPRLLARLEHVFGATDRRLSGTSLWRWLGRLVERADLPLRPVELFYLVAGCGLVLGLLLALATGSPLAVFWAPLLVAGCAYAYVSTRASRRLRAFDDQLPDVLTEVAAALRVGHSLVQSLSAAADDARPPIGKELRRVLAEVRLGRPLEASLADLGRRVPSKELEFALTAITIQRQVGGSLAGLFELVADTVRQRHQFHRKLRSLTAMGKLSAYVVAAMPFALAGLMSLRDRSYLSPLFASSGGRLLLIGAGLFMLVGAVILKKIVTVKG